MTIEMVYCSVEPYKVDVILTRLKEAGLSEEDISVLIIPDKVTAEEMVVDAETHAAEGAATGAGTGAVVGSGLALLAGIGSLTIPGFGPLLAAGPLLSALTGAVVGGTFGGITGALIGVGIPEQEIPHYEQRVKAGEAFVSVHAHSPEQAVQTRRILEIVGAKEISTAILSASGRLE